MTALPIDHIVFLVPDIDHYVTDFARITGVTPVFGGVHAHMGTKNYLVRLDSGDGNPEYLEFLGLDAAQSHLNPSATTFGVGRYGPTPYPHLLTWAVHPGNLEDVSAGATARGIEVGAVENWSREAPDGTLLKWRVAFNPKLPYGGLQPFLIDWGSTPHPSSNPQLDTLRVLDFRLEHPSPDELSRTLTVLGLKRVPTIIFGLVPTIILTVETPHGRLDLH